MRWKVDRDTTGDTRVMCHTVTLANLRRTRIIVIIETWRRPPESPGGCWRGEAGTPGRASVWWRPHHSLHSEPPWTSGRPTPGTAWSTLIGRGMSRLVSHWSRASLVMLAPAILCHKEPSRWHKDSWLPRTERSYYRRLDCSEDWGPPHLGQADLCLTVRQWPTGSGGRINGRQNKNNYFDKNL